MRDRVINLLNRYSVAEQNLQLDLILKPLSLCSVRTWPLRDRAGR